MAKALNRPLKERKSKSKLIIRMILPMLLLVILQLVTFFAILIVGGEFSYIKHYAYKSLVETTYNRKNIIQSELQQKMPIVQESAAEIDELIEELLTERDATISDLQTDKDLNLLIMESSVESLVDLLRNSRANGVHLILDSGSLYSEDGEKDAKTALYLRDLDPTTNAGYDDLLMETGYSSISQKFGIPLDSGWSLYFEPDPEDMQTFDYYYKTMQTAQEYNMLPLEDLGYWSGFSKHSRSAASNMRYTVPLIAEDGTVYGVLGIGMTENSILTSIPANDFTSISACYVLGHSSTENQYDIVSHSGTAFNRLVGNKDILTISGMLDDDVYDFSVDTGIDIAGSVQSINLYRYQSPYYSEQWALISVADRASVLSPLTNMIQMLFMAGLISLVFSIIIVIFICRGITKPISTVIQTMDSNQKYNQVLRFEPSNIFEIDRMTNAITQLQINVQDSSSQMSKMLRIANIGLGMFLYDHIDDSMFVGQSCLKMLHFHMQQDEDAVMSRQAFLDNITSDETKQIIMEGLEMTSDKTQADHIREYSITQADGSTEWMRISLIHTKNKSIGVLQDITSMMMEKQRIEYERDYDTTTGLLNRRAYYRKIEELFRNPDMLKITAILMIDLDNLKYVNDTYGHDFGDDYIKTAATTLKSFQNYGGIVARLSGDEFNVCLSGYSTKDEIREIIYEVRSQLLQKYCLLADGTHYKIRGSMGLSWYPDDAKTAEMLMKYADFAMYTVKHSTKGELAEFDMSAYETDSVLLTGVEEMNRIIDEVSVRYAFHSIVSAKTGEIYGYEALIRPQSTIFQSASELLRVAKTGAKLYEIERLTWTKALDDFQTQIDEGRIAKDCHIFINSISNAVLKLSDADIIEAEHPNLLSQIIMEVRESETTSKKYIDRKINRIVKWNAQIALDDFGTGYNNESALITLQPNIIKIDRAIVGGCDKDTSRRTIINNLINLAHSKEILVLAEGVETEGELRTVIGCGVDLLQGFYLNRPVFEPQPLAPEVMEMIKELAAQD